LLKLYIRNVYIGRNYGLEYLSIYGNYMVKVKGCVVYYENGDDGVSLLVKSWLYPWLLV
jgi:hypothetical protein